MSNRRILLIDFDRRTREAWSSLLEERGYEVAQACTAAEISERLQESHPRLVIIEPMIPGQDGFALCRALKKDEATAPAVIIASSIFKGARYRGMAREAGADLFLEKPIAQDLLVAMVGKLLPPPTEEELAAARQAKLAGPAPATPSAPATASSAPPAEAAASAAAPAIPLGVVPAAPEPLLENATDDDIESAFGKLLANPGSADTPRPPAPARTPVPTAELSAEEIAAALDRLELGPEGPERTREEASAEERPPMAGPTGLLGEELDRKLEAVIGAATGEGTVVHEEASEPPAGLRGMDPGTAELLTSLEEVEQSLPDAGEPPEPREIEPSVPHEPPPPPEEERSLEEVFDKVEGSEPVTASPATGETECVLAPGGRDEALGVVDAPAPRASILDPDDIEAEARDDREPGGGPRRAGLLLLALLVALVGASTGGYLYWGRTARTPAAPEILTHAIDRAPVQRIEVAPEPAGRERPRPEAAAVRPAPSEARFVRQGPARSVLPIRAIPRADGKVAAPGTGRETMADGTPVRLARIGELDHPLQRLSGELPKLPAGARAGRVVVRLLIGADGRVVDSEVTGDPGSWTETVRRAVARWRYAPPVAGGQPVRVWTTEIIDLAS